MLKDWDVSMLKGQRKWAPMTVQGLEKLSGSLSYRIITLLSEGATLIIFDPFCFFSVAVNCGDPPPVDNAQAFYVSELHEPLYTAAVRYQCEAPYYTLENEGDGEHCL